MTHILIPMAGGGTRFANAGYKLPKPLLPLTDRHTGKKVPMVVAAVNDLLRIQESANPGMTFVVRDFHLESGVVDDIRVHFPRAHFIMVDHLTQGQAETCLLAKDKIDTSYPLIISACDNGMDVKPGHLEKQSNGVDAVIFTFRNNPAVNIKPEAYGWIKTAGNVVTGVSIKKPISAMPMQDHAVVGTFWFRHGHDFVEAAEIMIGRNERINGEFYVDQVFQNMLERGKRIRVLEVDRYHCWGTPEDYENHEKTVSYWKEYAEEEMA